MTFGTWWLFTLATALISATPGPNMLHVMGQSARLGFRKSTLAMAGCLSAVLLCVTASAAGVGALLTASESMFALIRIAGAAYLIWLGWKSWTAPLGTAELGVAGNAGLVTGPALTIYRTALLTGLSNPKLIVFAAAFFPQFIRADRPWAPQFAVLVATFAVIEVSFYVCYAFGGRKIASYLSSPPLQRLFDRTTGILFMLFGCALLVWRD